MNPKTLKAHVVKNNFYGHRFNSMNDVVILLKKDAYVCLIYIPLPEPPLLIQIALYIQSQKPSAGDTLDQEHPIFFWYPLATVSWLLKHNDSSMTPLFPQAGQGMGKIAVARRLFHGWCTWIRQSRAK